MKEFRNKARELLEMLETNEGELSEEDAKKKYVELVDETFRHVNEFYDDDGHLREFIEIIERVGFFISI